MQIPEKWLLKHVVKFPKKILVRDTKKQHYTQIGIQKGNTCLIIGVSYYITKDRNILITRNAPIFKWEDDYLLASAYFSMGRGYYPKPQIEWKRPTANSWYFHNQKDWVEHWYKCDKPWIKHTNYWSPKHLTSKQLETSYKEGWLKYIASSAVNDSPKARVALGVEWLSKDQWKEFMVWSKHRKIDFQLYKDYLVEARRRKLPYLNNDWKKLHDKWNGLTDRKLIEKKLSKIKTIRQIHKFDNLDQLTSIGNFMHVCAGKNGNHKDYKNFYYTKQNGVYILAKHDGKKMLEIKADSNVSIPKELEKQFERKIYAFNS